MFESNRSIDLQSLIKELKLEVDYLPRPASEIQVHLADVGRPGLPLMGYFEHFEPERIQIIGNAEYAFLEKKSAQNETECVTALLSHHPVAIVFTHGNMPIRFSTMVKQHGAMVAKGRLLGVQFDALFTDGLYNRIGAHVIAMAMKLKAMFGEKGYRFFLDSPTNQQFVIVDNETLARLQEKVVLTVWEPFDDSHTVVRFVTGWSTTDADIDALSKIV